MSIITLTTDWGLRDHYLASFKGELLSLLPDAKFVDISHDIEKFNIMQAAYVIQNAFRKFPKGSIHFISVSCNENCGLENPYVIIRSDEQFLIGEDNGLFTLILDQHRKDIFRLPIAGNAVRKELNKILLETIKSLSGGQSAELLGILSTELKESYFAKPIVDHEAIRGTIIYIDDFGNVMVNIKKSLFEEACKERNFTIHLRKATYNVTEISASYEGVEVGEMLALFNEDDFLEISLNKESASKLLGLKLMDPIRIEFHD